MHFKVIKRQHGNNINKVVNSGVQSGKIESINIITTGIDHFTILVALSCFSSGFPLKRAFSVFKFCNTHVNRPLSLLLHKCLTFYFKRPNYNQL